MDSKFVRLAFLARERAWRNGFALGVSLTVPSRGGERGRGEGCISSIANAVRLYEWSSKGSVLSTLVLISQQVGN